MKYIIFKSGNLFHPVVFADHTSHCDMLLKNATPISAGFVEFGIVGVKRVYGKSDSLNLGNRGMDDEYILQDMYLNSGTNSFIDWDNLK